MPKKIDPKEAAEIIKKEIIERMEKLRAQRQRDLPDQTFKNVTEGYLQRLRDAGLADLAKQVTFRLNNGVIEVSMPDPCPVPLRVDPFEAIRAVVKAAISEMELRALTPWARKKAYQIINYEGVAATGGDSPTGLSDLQQSLAYEICKAARQSLATDHVVAEVKLEWRHAEPPYRRFSPSDPQIIHNQLGELIAYISLQIG